MRFAECPYCKEELEINESYDIDVEGIEIMINRFAGQCPKCNKEFLWEGIYKYSHFSNLEEIEE